MFYRVGFLFFIAPFLLNSCKKDSSGTCNHLNLSKQKQIYNGALNLSGYYFGNKQVDFESNEDYEIFTLYTDGVVLQTGWAELDDLNNEVAQTSGSMSELQKHKTSWGVFTQTDNMISIEHWIPRQCGLWVKKRTGEVVNDTTFVLTTEETRKHNETETESIKQTFRFRKYSPKPDSTNKFIK